MATYIVKPNQNLFDVALHLYGSIEGIFDLMRSNPELSMTSELLFGQELVYHEEFIINASIVNEFQKQNIEPHYIGSKKGIEKDIISELDIPYHEISSGKLRRYLSFENLKDIYKNSRSEGFCAEVKRRIIF